MVKAQKSELAPDITYRKAMRSLIATRFGILWKAIPVAVEGSNPEGVHDVRVASRRLRAAMDVAVGCFPDEWYRPLHATAKQITSELGEVRDRDVMIEFLSAERDRVPAKERVGIERLLQRVEREREVARVTMLTYLEGLETAGVAEEVERRFGDAARAPWVHSKESER